MSKPSRLSDRERTGIMTELVRRKYDGDGPGVSRAWIACEEVSSGTGWNAGRYADVLALAIWPSLGHKLIGYEVKATRADLKRELASPNKHTAVAKFCDEWWLVAWSEAVLLPGIPESWGILLVQEADNEHELVVHRNAAPRTPEPLTRSFIASLVRNAYEQSVTSYTMARAIADASRRGNTQGVIEERSKATHKLNDLLLPIRQRLYGKDHYKWPSEAWSPDTLMARVLAELDQPALAATTGSTS